jgi:hypothetical protein
VHPPGDDPKVSTFLLEKDGRKIRMLHIKEGKGNNNNNNNYNSGRRVMLCSVKEFLKEERKSKYCFSIIPKSLSPK